MARGREDGDEIAFRTERISRSVCRAVAEYSFRTAERIHGRVYGGPKWTVCPVYEGMLKEEMDAAAERHPEVPYQPVLIDATYAGLISRRGRRAARDPGAQPRRRLPLRPRACRCSARSRAPSRCCSRFDEDYEPKAVMAEAPHGTAPALQGKDIANPMAMILAAAALLHYAGERGLRRAPTASRAIYESVLEATATGVRTPDLGGHAATSEFTDEVIARVRTKIDIWSSLGSTVCAGCALRAAAQRQRRPRPRARVAQVLAAAARRSSGAGRRASATPASDDRR